MAVDDGAVSDAPVAPRPRHLGVVFGVLSLGVVSFGGLQSLLAPALTVIRGHLDTSQSSVSWVMTAYLLSAAVATPILGRLGDIYGKKHVLLVAQVALVVGSVIGALATSIGVMIVARVIQGLGGGVLPTAFSIIRDEFPAARVGSAIGAVSSMVAVGGGAGIVLSGVITESWGYEWLFWLPGIVAAIAAVATAVLVPESPIRTPGKVNLVGAGLLSAALVALLVPISKGEQWGWASARVVVPIAAAVVLFVAWAIAEWRAAEPLVDMRMMRERAVWTTNLASLLFGFVMLAYMTFLPQFVQTPQVLAGYGFDASVTDAGLMLLPGAVVGVFVGPIAGWLTGRIGGKPVVAFGAVMLGVATALFALFSDALWAMYAIGVVSGIGVAGAFSAMAALIVTSVRPHQVGVATAMNANVRTIGGSIGIAVMTAIVTSHTLPGGVPTESGYVNGFWFLTGAAALALLAALLVKTDPSRRAAVPESEGSAPIGSLESEPVR